MRLIRNSRRFFSFFIVTGIIGVLSYTVFAEKKSSDLKTWNKKDWGPLVPHKTFPKDCSICHVAKRWDVLKENFYFDHTKETGYPLAGAHASAACLRCHNDRGPVRAYVARGCAGCHVDAHSGNLGVDCSRCHNQMNWRAEKQTVQHAGTRFPLTGVHQAISCDQCHSGAATGNFRGAPTECFLCHRAQFQSAPNHAAMNFPQKCDQCHKTATWTQATFSHSLVAGSGGTCWNCHQKDFERAPNHVVKNYPRTCETCHNTASYRGAMFNHNAVPGATGACYTCHAADYQRGPGHVANSFSQSCQTCHNTNTWQGASFDHNSLSGGAGNCASCHMPEYQTAPNHAAMSFPQSCQNCHNTNTWTGATFSHSALPGGAGTCYTCHSADYQRAPSHVAMSYPQTCQNCHATTQWTGASLNHPFPLTGNHNVSCTSCHAGGNTATFTCLTCHAHAQPAMDDKHQNRNGYSYNSQACYNCHPNGRGD